MTTTTSFQKYLSIPAAAWILLVLLAVGEFPGHCRAGKKDSIFHAVSRHGRPSHGKGKVSKPVLQPGPWKKAHATFYDGSPSTFGGACDFKDVVQQGYGMNTAALSGALFNGGESCGACFELQCVDNPQFCRLGQPSLHVTATDHCPPNPSLPNDNGGWCNPPLEHFDIAHPVFSQLAEEKSGIIPVQYRRVPCQKRGGIRFTILGNPWFIQVIVTNVAGAGDVKSVMVKGDKVQWTRMERDWGETWKVSVHELVGESLTFRVKTTDGRACTAWHVAPKDWQFGQTYEGKKNFKT